MRDFMASRPVVAELEAIGRALLLAEDTGCALHVVHVSSGRGVALVAEARARGVDVSCETCPHYLVLTDADAERLGAVAKCAPPLRSPREREALWSALADGDLPMIASDHSPSPPSLKEPASAFAAWGGIAGAQTLLPLVLDEGDGRAVPHARLVDAISGFPARRLRLAGKGSLEPGSDADIALVRPDEGLDPRRGRPALAPSAEPVHRPEAAPPGDPHACARSHGPARRADDRRSASGAWSAPGTNGRQALIV